MKVLYDGKRHLIVTPYTRTNLHAVAERMGLKRHWFHASPYPHYDLPKSWVADFGLTLDEQLLNLDLPPEIEYEQVTTRQLLAVIKEAVDGEN